MTTSTHVGAGRRRARLSLLALTTMLSSGVAMAQTSQTAPVRQSVDGNGVDLFLGTYNVDAPAVTAGQDQGLAFGWFWRGAGWGDTATGQMFNFGSTMTVSIGEATDRFTISGGTYTATEGNGATLVLNGGGTSYTYRSADGTTAVFSKSAAAGTAIEALVTDISAPSGKTLHFNYESSVYCAQTKTNDPEICVREGTAHRLSGIKSNYGYVVALSYEDEFLDYTYPNFFGWYRRIAGTMDNLANSMGSSAPVTSFTVTASGGYSYGTATDPLGRSTVFRTNGPQMLGITRPGSGSEEITLSYSGGRVSSITTPAGTTNYSASDSSGVRTVTVTDPGSHNTVYTFDIASARMKSMTDPLSHATNWQYDSAGRVTRVTAPDGNYTQYTYDARGNVTETRIVAKSGSGISDIVTSATFDSTCSNPVTCNQPNTTTDARGYVTNYTYDSTHGGVTAVTSPAPVTSGTRPETRYGYTSLQAYFSNGSSIVASGEPVYKLTSVSTCRTTSSCSGGSDEVKTTIDYGPQTSGTGNNLLPVSVTTGAGDASLTATTTTGYDARGNAITVDGPLSGSADTTRYRYDAGRQPIGVVGPDPDGGGSLKHRAQKATYDAKGRVTLAEAGTVDSQSDGDWAAFTSAQQVTTDYDTADRKVKQTVTASSTTYGVTQFSYDADGRLECTAVRMNSATWGSLPGACTLATSGSDGPDRIARTTYDNADRPTAVETAYGTGDAVTEAMSYNDNGTAATVTDGNGNKTTYEYDGVDRLVKTRFPSTTTGSGTSSTTDYEQLTYDAGSKVTSRRLRDGNSIGYTYDNLGRATAKTTPGSVNLDWDLAYSYDLLGRVTGITGDGWASRSFAYDALGRMTSEANYNATTYHAYDLAGRQTRLTWNDSFYVDYDHLVTGEVSAIRENGASSGIGVLATYAYDNLGRRTGITRGNGTTTSYSYDNVSRLASLSHDMSGSTYDFTHGFTYNPAGQIASVTRSNDAYAWGGQANVTRGYTHNGLNQITASGATSIGYDSRGSVTGIGSDSFSYTSENRMASGPGATMAYEPGGDQLLTLYNSATGADTRFSWSGSQMISEINASGWGTMRRYVPGPGVDETVVWYEGSGTGDRRWLHADERGSVVAVSNASGVVTNVNSYDEYGVPASGNVGRFQYTGQAWIPEIGKYYYKARMYAPTLGRFMQTDPIGYEDGMNWYNYAGSNPINSIDPSGTKVPTYCTGSIIPGGDCSHVNFLSINGVDTQAAHMHEVLEHAARLEDFKKFTQGLSSKNREEWENIFDPLSSEDKALLAGIMADRDVVLAMNRAWGNTMADSGNHERSFNIYQYGDDFRAGKEYKGMTGPRGNEVTSPWQYREWVLAGGFKSAIVANYHTHPRNDWRPGPSDRDVIYNWRDTGTLGILQTRSGIYYGRTAHRRRVQ